MLKPYKFYYDLIPIDSENGISKKELAGRWGLDITDKDQDRRYRHIMRRLRKEDNGDDYIIVSELKESKIYKTDRPEEIIRFRKTVFNMGRSNMSPLKKIDRLLLRNPNQMTLVYPNNLKAAREAAGFSQSQATYEIQRYDRNFDQSLLSKLENDRCRPTPVQLAVMCKLYGVTAEKLVG